MRRRRPHTLQRIQGSSLDGIAGGRVFAKKTDDGYSLHVLTPEAEAEYNRCSNEADKSWFRPFKQFKCNWDLTGSLEEHKIGEIKNRR